MTEYDQPFDPNILIGHCDLISRFSDFSLYLGTQLVYEHISFTVMCMFVYDKTFDPKVVLGQCDLNSLFRDFALYLDTLLIYFHISFIL